MKRLFGVRLTAKLPDTVRSITYAKNHHYITLEDTEGNKTQLNAADVLIGQCTACNERVIAFTHQGFMTCTHCGGAVKWAWCKPQLGFIPEHESQFMGISKGEADIVRENMLKRLVNRALEVLNPPTKKPPEKG